MHVQKEKPGKKEGDLREKHKRHKEKL